MSSSQGRFGNYGGITCPKFQFTAAGQDSGPQCFGPNVNAQLRGVGLGWKDFIFMATGTGTGLQIRLYGTIDEATAMGVSSANGGKGEWFQLPAPSTEGTTAQWCNPVIPDPTGAQNAMYLKAPIIAVRAVSEQILSDAITGTTTLQMFSVS